MIVTTKRTYRLDPDVDRLVAAHCFRVGVRALAREAGVDASLVSRFLGGKGSVSERVFRALAARVPSLGVAAKEADDA